MNRKGRLVIAWVMLLAWMALIFFMSNQPADVSSAQSAFIVQIIERLGIHIGEQNLNLVTTIIRKGAHVTEYAILGLLAYNVIRYYIETRKARFIAFIIVVLYACSDEFHQMFVPGRAGRFTDVLIDSCGGMISFLIISFINTKNRWLSNVR